MINSISSVIPEVTIHNNRAVTTSIAVATYFQKRHDHVMEKIRAVMADCSPAWRLPNFRETSYTRENPNGGVGISTPMFELTRDAFALIVMGFTGKKALQWKIDYINAFNAMEAELQHRSAPPAPLVPVFPTGQEFRFVTDVDATGRPISMTVLRPDEFIASWATHTDMLRHMGMIVIEPEDLDNMATKKVAMLIDAARRAKAQWIKGVEF